MDSLASNDGQFGPLALTQAILPLRGDIACSLSVDGIADGHQE